MDTLLVTNKGLLIREDDGHEFLVPSPIYSLKSLPVLARRPICVGFIGQNGGGKTTQSAKEATLTHMIPGDIVFSNTDMGFHYVFHDDRGWHNETRSTRPIAAIEERVKQMQAGYRDGKRVAIIWDEFNIKEANARRAMSNDNLDTQYIAQQKRKLNADIFWSAVSEMDVDPSLRDKTDIYVRCEDVAATPGGAHVGVGEMSHLTYIDYSDMVVGHVHSPEERKFRKTTVWNRPWWNIFLTGQMQLRKKDARAQAEEEAQKLAYTLAERMKSIMDASGEDRTPVRKLLHAAGVPADRNLRRQINEFLGQWGIESDSRGRYYEKFGVVDVSTL